MRKKITTLGASIAALMILASCTNSSNNARNTNNEVDHAHTAQANVTPPTPTQNPHAEASNQSEQSNTAANADNTVTESTSAAPAQPVVHEPGKPVPAIPTFKFYKVKSGISYENSDLPKGRKTMFILFDPGCSYCRIEAGELGKNYDKIKNVNLLFVSMNDPALMATFLETYAKELVGKSNVEMLYDRNQEFIQKFHIPSQFPANYIYTPDGALETYWDGVKDINYIISQLTK